MANVYKGVGCHWGVASTTYSMTNGKLQSRDHSKKAATETIKDSDGVTISKIIFDPNEEATFEAVITGSAGTGTVVPVLPAIGDAVVVTDTVNFQISGSASGANTWLVDDVSTKSSNSSAMRVTIKLSRFTNLTV